MAAMGRCFVINARDNVATLLDPVAAGVTVQVLGAAGTAPLAARHAIDAGHKIALGPVASGASIIKFGVPIGRATADIAAGDWVHLHNCASFVDARSGSLDLHTGSATDTRYA